MIYLFLEILFWIALAVLTGIIIGWYVWGKKTDAILKDNDALKLALKSRNKASKNASLLQKSLADEKLSTSELSIEIEKLKTKLDTQSQTISELNSHLNNCKSSKDELQNSLDKVSEQYGQLKLNQAKSQHANEDSSLDINEEPITIQAFSDLPSKQSKKTKKASEQNNLQADLVDTSSKDIDDIIHEDRPTALKEAKNNQPDDLTTIKGIGPVLNKKLNGLGIFHFEQIAELTRKNIEWIDGYLSFKGRIDREEWVEQAKAIVSNRES